VGRKDPDPNLQPRSGGLAVFLLGGRIGGGLKELGHRHTEGSGGERRRTVFKEGGASEGGRRGKGGFRRRRLQGKRKGSLNQAVERGSRLNMEREKYQNRSEMLRAVSARLRRKREERRP